VIRTIILLLFGCTILYKTMRSLRAHRLKERHVLVFLITGLPFLVLALWPDGIVFLSQRMEIEKPTLMILASSGFLILLIFELLSIVSQQDSKIASLAQVVALLMEQEKMVERGERGEASEKGLLEAQRRAMELGANSKFEIRNSNQIPNSNDPMIK
jgi:hypothetical protein